MKTMGVILMCKQKITKVVGVAGQQSKSCFQTERLSQINGGDIDVSLVSKLKNMITKNQLSQALLLISIYFSTLLNRFTQRQGQV